jgi:hypothetical protein
MLTVYDPSIGDGAAFDQPDTQSGCFLRAWLTLKRGMHKDGQSVFSDLKARHLGGVEYSVWGEDVWLRCALRC